MAITKLPCIKNFKEKKCKCDISIQIVKLPTLFESIHEEELLYIFKV